MKLLAALALLLLALMLGSCISIVIGATPTPPGNSPPIAAPPQGTVPAGTCISWTEASSHIGESTCVRGTVRSASKQGSTFFINFDNANDSFYGVSFKHTWDDLRGKCVEIRGKLATFRGKPQIVIEDKEQLSICR